MIAVHHPALTSPIRVPDYIIVGRPKRILVADIVRATCEWYGLTTDDITSNSRRTDTARPRQLAMYLCRHHTKRSYAEIGRVFGKRHHTTAMEAVRVVTRRIDDDSDLRADHDAIVEALKG
jgi:chromosomal replication initiator protein